MAQKEIRVVWKCGYCLREFPEKEECELHEEGCRYRPRAVRGQYVTYSMMVILDPFDPFLSL